MADGKTPLSYQATPVLTTHQPPGPLPWPICGNTFSIPGNKPRYYLSSSQKTMIHPGSSSGLEGRLRTTSIYHAESLIPHRKPTIWIDDAWAAHELLVKRAGIYNSRPRMLMFAELGMGQSNLLHKYIYTKQQRERYRDLRKLTHHGVGVQQVCRANT
jgi:hypothetical protein